MSSTTHRASRAALRLGVGLAMSGATLVGWAAAASADLPAPPSPNPITQTYDTSNPGTVWMACQAILANNPNAHWNTFHSSYVGSTIFEEVGDTFCPAVI